MANSPTLAESDVANLASLEKTKKIAKRLGKKVFLETAKTWAVTILEIFWQDR